MLKKQKEKKYYKILSKKIIEHLHIFFNKRTNKNTTQKIRGSIRSKTYKNKK